MPARAVRQQRAVDVPEQVASSQPAPQRFAPVARRRRARARAGPRRCVPHAGTRSIPMISTWASGSAARTASPWPPRTQWLSSTTIRRPAGDVAQPVAVDVAQPRQQDERRVLDGVRLRGEHRAGADDHDVAVVAHDGPSAALQRRRRRAGRSPAPTAPRRSAGRRGRRPRARPTRRSAVPRPRSRAPGRPSRARCPSARCRGSTGASGRGRRARCRRGSPRRSPACPRWRC